MNVKIRDIFSRMRSTTALLGLAGAALVLSGMVSLYLAGCTDTLDGDVFENQKPIVQFVNIPPAGQRFSRNPVVYWRGSDPDGLIVRYRYFIVRDSIVGLEALEDFILTVHDSEWTYVDVDPAASDPQTEHAIPLVANVDDPVNTFVSQWVFLQAFDMQGLGSDIVYRLFSRNDHPPQTGIYDFSVYLPYVDGPPGGIVTGVKLSWWGDDPIDYPSDPPPFEFQWRLYGPYEDSVYLRVVDSFVAQVLVTEDGYVYNIGDTVVRCDTLYGDSIMVRCTTVVVASGMIDPLPWGHMETKFFIDDEDFLSDPAVNKVADSSFDGNDVWVLETSDTMYNVFRSEPSDTTQEKWFFFWIRSRDDALVADLVPAFDSFTVIDPRFERDIGVLDFTVTGGIGANIPYYPSKKLWGAILERWPRDVIFDTTAIGSSGWQRAFAPDHILVNNVGGLLGEVPLSFLLKHKVLVLYDDAIISAIFPDYSRNIYKAIDAGLNVWASWRAPIIGDPNMEEQWQVFPAPEYTRYFGVAQMTFSAWYCHATPWDNSGIWTVCEDYAARIEDFVGAFAIDTINWPNLDVDPVLVQTRLRWGPYASLRYVRPAVPEVNWSVRTPPTDVLYLYKSYFGPDHPMGGPYNMEGSPVAHRLGTFLFRTAHFNFTPLCMDSVQMQVVADKILDWLYPSDLDGPTAKVRYPDAGSGLSVGEAKAAYWRRADEEAKTMDPKKQPDRGRFLRLQ